MTFKKVCSELRSDYRLDAESSLNGGQDDSGVKGVKSAVSLISRIESAAGNQWVINQWWLKSLSWALLVAASDFTSRWLHVSEKIKIRFLLLDFLAFVSFIPHNTFEFNSTTFLLAIAAPSRQARSLARAICKWTRRRAAVGADTQRVLAHQIRHVVAGWSADR